MCMNYSENGFESFADIITETMDACLKTDPKLKKSKRNRISNPWITEALSGLLRKRIGCIKSGKRPLQREIKQVVMNSI